MNARDDRVLLDTLEGSWSAARFEQAVASCARHLRSREVGVLATQLDNTVEWIVADAAARRSGAVHLPLPAFFTETQIAHALHAAGADALWLPATTHARDATTLEFGHGLAVREQRHGPSPDRPTLPRGTRVVSFTSGTTGAPKGVCLGARQLDTIALSIGAVTEALQIRRHLCALPLAVLLEHVAGVLAPIARGATVILRPLAQVGLGGPLSFEAARLDAVVRESEAHSVIVLPRQLRAWTAWLHAQGRRAAPSLRLVAVGGAPVGEVNLLAARALGLPAYEGYGLCEGGSVQTLNLPGRERAGSAGRPLPHTRLRIGADGEIEIGGALGLGYLGESERIGDWLATGDLGRIDDDGFLHVTGRKQQVLVTACGRRVSPEWVETLLHQQSAIAQSVVLGDGQPRLAAVLWPSSAVHDDDALRAAVGRANSALPDYARIVRWVRARGEFTAAAGFATANGRPRRAAVADAHGPLLFHRSADALS